MGICYCGNSTPVPRRPGVIVLTLGVLVTLGWAWPTTWAWGQPTTADQAQPRAKLEPARDRGDEPARSKADSTAKSASNSTPAPSTTAGKTAAEAAPTSALGSPIVDSDAKLAGQRVIVWRGPIEAPGEGKEGQGRVQGHQPGQGPGSRQGPVQTPGQTPSQALGQAQARLDNGQERPAGSDRSARWVMLDGRVRFAVGAYAFVAKRAVVRIDRDRQPGRVVGHLAAYLVEAKPAQAKGPIKGQAPHLLVTASTTGQVELEADAFNSTDQPPTTKLVRTASKRIGRYLRAKAQPVLDVPRIARYQPSEDQSRQRRRAAIARQNERASAGGGGVGSTTARGPAKGLSAGQSTPSPTQAGQTQPAPQQGGQPTQPSPAQAILPTHGSVRFNADRVVYEPGEAKRERPSLMLIGNVRLFYAGTTGGGPSGPSLGESRSMTLKAQRMVIFLSRSASPQSREAKPVVGGSSTSAGESASARAGLTDAQDAQAAAKPSPPSSPPASPPSSPPIAVNRQRLSASDVRGIYLEDDAIVSDGQYTVRAPRIYYDPSHNEAVLLKAVFYTYDMQRNLPLYFRAEEVRQRSRTSFQARGARLTTSEFGTPHFAIGAGQLTVNQTKRPSGSIRTNVQALNSTLRWYDVPVFYWPYIAGEAEDIPVKNLSVGADHSGIVVKSSYDLFELAGQQTPEGVGLSGHLDLQGDHGLGTGLNLDYDFDQMFGRLDGYVLPHDTGQDDIGDRRKIDFDGQTRGFAHFQHRQFLPEDFTLSLEASYVSDETFLEELFRGQTVSHRDYETSAYLKKQDGSQAVTFYARDDLTDFTPQLPTLEAPGYTVARAPEVGYYQTGASFADGLLSWYSENRLGRLKLDIGEDSPSDRGISNRDSQRFFGINATTAFDDAAAARGLPGDFVTRADSRQELTAPLHAGPIDLTPFVSGRVTAYDSDFSQLNGTQDQVRLLGTVGTRVRTEISRTYTNVNSGVLDLHGIRHIIEPQLDLFYIDSTIDQTSLPVYDPEVESLAEGTGARIGATQTWQTRRGGPGRWRTVDWIKLRTDLVLRGDQADDEVLPRYFNYRPEYSIGGDHLYTELLWMVTDTLGVNGDVIEDLDHGKLVQWRVGASLRHTSRLRSFLRYQQLNPVNTKLLSYGFSYKLTTKYRLGFVHSLSFDNGQSRNIGLTLERKLPRWRLRVVAGYDQIDSETVVGFTLSPVGLGYSTPTLGFAPGGFTY